MFGAIDTGFLGVAALIGASFAGVLGAIVLNRTSAVHPMSRELIISTSTYGGSASIILNSEKW